MHKACRRCGRFLPFTKFNKNMKTKGGLENTCRDCTSMYDAARLYDPKRIAMRLAYLNTEAGRRNFAGGAAKWAKKNPDKRAAHHAVSNAIRSGRLKKQPCAICGNEQAEAHHHDYSKPLDVHWLCRPCHMAQHVSENAAKRLQRFATPPGDLPSKAA